MPLKDPSAKRAAARRWRERSTPAYKKWLYERRKLRFENAEWFREAIEEALRQDDLVAIRRILVGVLEDAELRAREVGNRFDHALDEPYYDEEKE